MKLNRGWISSFILFCLVTLVSVGYAFGQRPPGGGPPGGRPPGGGPPGGRPGDGPRPDGPPDRGPRPTDRPGDRPGPPLGRRPPLGPQADMLSAEMRFGDRPVKGIPYSAQFVTETTQTLGDGTRIIRKSNGAVYRNSEGRTRREQTLGAIGPIAFEGEPSQLILINDPVAGAHYVLDVNSRSARKLPFRDAPPAQESLPAEVADQADPVQTESLGKQTIEGVTAEGTRSVITIPTGRVGNDRPLEIVSERWYSPDLQVTVLSKHKDPFAGEVVYRLINIARVEPPLNLFEVPAGYSIVEEKPPKNGPRPPRP